MPEEHESEISWEVLKNTSLRKYKLTVTVNLMLIPENLGIFFIRLVTNICKQDLPYEHMILAINEFP